MMKSSIITRWCGQPHSGGIVPNHLPAPCFFHVDPIHGSPIHTMRAKSFQSCLTLCNPMDCSPPGSSVYGILQARILQWVAIALLQGIFLTQRSNPCLLTSPELAGGFFTTSATWGAHIMHRMLWCLSFQASASSKLPFYFHINLSHSYTRGHLNTTPNADPNTGTGAGGTLGWWLGRWKGGNGRGIFILTYLW